MTVVPHRLITASGTLGLGSAPVEAFSFGLRVKATADSTLQADVDALWTAYAAFFGSAGARISSMAQLRQLKISDVAATGLVAGTPVVHTGLQAGGNTTRNPFPPQVSLAVSLTTGVRGARNRGRFYLPMPVQALDASTLLLSATERDDLEVELLTLLRAVNTRLKHGSDGLSIISSFGTSTAVTGFRVGRAYDTIRSRRRSVNETYDIPTAL